MFFNWPQELTSSYTSKKWQWWSIYIKLPPHHTHIPSIKMDIGWTGQKEICEKLLNSPVCINDWHYNINKMTRQQSMGWQIGLVSSLPDFSSMSWSSRRPCGKLIMIGQLTLFHLVRSINVFVIVPSRLVYTLWHRIG